MKIKKEYIPVAVVVAWLVFGGEGITLPELNSQIIFISILAGILALSMWSGSSRASESVPIIEPVDRSTQDIPVSEPRLQVKPKMSKREKYKEIIEAVDSMPLDSKIRIWKDETGLSRTAFYRWRERLNLA